MNFDFDETPEEWTVDTLNKRLDALVVGEQLRIEDLPNEIYHQCKGVSTSKLKLFIECPYKYHAMYIAMTMAFEDKQYFSFGRAGHTTLLEPHKLDKEFTCMSDYSGTGSAAKRALFEAQAKREGKEILTQAQWDAQPLLRKAIDAHPTAKRLLSNGVAEVSYFIRDAETDLIIKCRPDYMISDLIVDLKTSDTTDPRFVGAKFRKMGYDIQDALYTDVVQAENFVFVAIESKAPYVVTAPIIFDDSVKRLGYLKYRKAIRELKRCMDTDHWSMYTEKTLTIKASKFDLDELQKLENENE